MTIFLSTGGYNKKTALEASKDFYSNGITAVELSGGVHCPNAIEEIVKLRAKIDFQVHNYFPPPEEPFVLNLASKNPDISELSIKHIYKAMELSLRLDQPRYSFHAGFLIDPKVDQLGKRIKKKQLLSRDQGLKLFIDRLNIISERARELGVDLLVENNVISKANFKEFQSDPFLMSTCEECIYVMKNTPDNINLLVDLAHLKVSATTLSYNPIEFLNLVSKWIKGYHLSDNNGIRDENKPVTLNSWFWPYLKKDLQYYSLEVYNTATSELLNQQLIVKSFLNS
ncbi:MULTISPECIES: sugar phosphate isomerase/epimerase family protein [Prochlorococcus]|uniref:sugar phosphate isomerase/epimerase family protein n=1 Tax=Prochlorococcus TaxID=1218 RepID=UPI0005337413|nr:MULTISPECIES: TIM barrel protein [Prochlorococcus]KGG12106.1 Xylose isomerase domain protein TIM barrel [Prochlorococcus sp. MIT 0601]